MRHNSGAEMTPGEENEKKTTMGDETRGNRKLSSCCSSLREDLVEAEQSRLGIYELPALFNLAVQRYEGETCGGQFNGGGVAHFEGGHVYQGVFSRGLMDGPGVFTWADGLKYEGEFAGNTPMGQGTYTWPDGSSYKGEVHSGIRHGSGVYKCAKSGVSYTGQWDQGKRHGKGTVYYNQNKTSWYKGDWVKNNREGWGVRCYPSGNIYSGEWKSNRTHGQGTMRWLKLEQQYVGQWVDGVQHGRGTHVWILRRANEFQYSQRNQYTGDFVQGQKHGQGTFYYADGAVYEGEWKNNNKHGKGKFTFKDGHVFEGEFVDDRMMTPSLHRTRVPTPLCDTLRLGPDVALNIERLLDEIPKAKWNTERRRVELVVLSHDTELRSIYSFYSRLGRTPCPDNTYLLSRLQLWRLLKDCKIHHHGITLTQIDHLIRDNTSTEIHFPFTPMLFRRLISFLVTVAHRIYSKDMVSEKNLLTGCFSKLMTDDILPNARNVKGFLFGQPGLAEASATYMKRCWEVYQAVSDDQTMTGRRLMWMFKDLCLLDSNLNTVKLMEAIAAESCDFSLLSSCLDMEITFLEFFEVLLCCAEVKCQRFSEGPEKHHSMSRSKPEARRDPSEEMVPASPSSPIIPEIPSPTSVEIDKCEDTTEQSLAHDMGNVKDKVSQQLLSAENTEEDISDGKAIQSRRVETKRCEPEFWAVDQFFNRFFFPAFENYQLVTKYMKEHKLHKEDQRAIALEKAQ